MEPTNRAERLLPLLRSIAQELRDRHRSIAELDARVRSLKASPKIHAEDLRLAEATLAIERRELRHAEEEVGRLGCRLDEDDRERILLEGEQGPSTLTWKLGDTSFRQLLPVDSAA